MISVIADILKTKLENLTWMERFGGMVQNATRPEFIKGADGVNVVKGYQTYPVSCGVNATDCWENDRYKHFEPNSTKSAIAFFAENGGTVMKGYEGPFNMFLRFTFDIKFLCWMNLNRLGEDITAGGCLPSGRVAPFVISQLFGDHSATGLFAGGLEEEVFQGIEVTGIRELTKNPSMFEPFTFARDGANRGLFIYPYDYFGLAITGTFVFNRNCLPEFGVDWEPSVSCVSPAGGTSTPGNGTSNWFNGQMLAWLAARPAYQSNEDATAGLEVIYGTGNAIGKPYWAAQGHVAAPEGTFMRVVA
jgi:hypothetical protein